MEWKKALEEGRGWELAGTRLSRLNRRTPDGYFEASLEGQPHTFVLEYEHSPYNREQMGGMVLNLVRDFPQAFRLMVSRDKEHAVRLAEGLGLYLKERSPTERPLGIFLFRKGHQPARLSECLGSTWKANTFPS